MLSASLVALVSARKFSAKGARTFYEPVWKEPLVMGQYASLITLGYTYPLSISTSTMLFVLAWLAGESVFPKKLNQFPFFEDVLKNDHDIY